MTLLTAGFFTFDRSWNQVKFITELHVLQCLFVRGSNKKQRRVVLFQISSLTYINQVIMWSPFLHPSKKVFLSPSVWARREYIWKLNWKESLLIYFENGLGAHCSNRQSRNRMMNTLIIIVNITSLEDKSMLLVHFKKVFPLTLLWHSFERRAYWLLFHFESYQGIPYSYTGKVDRGWWTLC